MDNYYTQQIITYMGNKRKVIPHIEEIINIIKQNMNKDNLSIGDGFSGSGVVSRLFKNHASELYVNDLAGYSKTINSCYLATPNKPTLAIINKYIDAANLFVKEEKDKDKEEDKDKVKKFIQLHWAPSNDKVKADERAYYTKENGRRIDSYQHYINTIPIEYRHFLLAPRLHRNMRKGRRSEHYFYVSMPIR